MSAKHCGECKGTGIVCPKCTNKRFKNEPHQGCGYARPRKCPAHVNSEYVCDVCGVLALHEREGHHANFAGEKECRECRQLRLSARTKAYEYAEQVADDEVLAKRGGLRAGEVLS